MSFQKCNSESGQLNGLYRGRVVKHLEHGILKVYIPDIYPSEYESNPDKLPDAEVMVPLFGGNLDFNGVFSYPNVGANVVCQFLNGDQNLPIVVGATQGGSLASLKYQEVANELDPATGKEPACIHMVNVGRSKVKIYEGGMIELKVCGKEGKTAQFTLDQNGNIIINCDGNFQVKAKNIKQLAQSQIAEVAGSGMVLTAKDIMTLHSKDIGAMCPNGVFSAQTSKRLTQM